VRAKADRYRTVDWFDALVGYFAVDPVWSFVYWHSPKALRELPVFSSYSFGTYSDHASMLAVPLFWYSVLRRRFPIGALRWSELRGWVWPGAIAIAFMLSMAIGITFAGLGADLRQAMVISPAGFVFELTVPGLGEEFLWRGLIQTGLNTSFPYRIPIFRGVGVGTILAALGFGATHLGNGGQPHLLTILQVCSAVIGGLILGIGYERTNNIWGAVIVHNISNIALFAYIALALAH
jgi:membrane protease YdiL (CAAX protease family)